MDIILEIWDTFIGDHLYSTLLPTSVAASVSLPAFINANSSLALFGNGDSFVYEPATQLFRLEPSQYAYLSAWPRDNMYRQFMSFFLITWIFGLLVYFVVATLSFIFVWDKTTYNHPKFLKNQVALEIKQAMSSMPPMALLTAPFFVLEVRGYAKLYDTVAEEPFPYYSILQFPIFIVFTDFFIYWIHRGLHHPSVYRTLHKPHHKWIMPSPFASHAFHPLDGWSQSVPYHVFPFIFPLQKLAYVFLFAFINLWTVFIHDGEYVANSPVVNGAACHTMHHLYFNYNYGQFTTLWDRLGGSYRKPNEELFRRETKMGDKEWKRQAKEMETILKTVEGDDDRSYSADTQQKKDL
ncbi:Delta(7)-sterol 5(6)-desaturase [Penicillium macrosclerotiorum]|uniref:Delta(7)-sterol 5(6)-desaturase n=1 Tax=Penicillium macrosclerotiorum TaxID=303699 RepID=UPI0025487BA4|nr:Delta(7)-sterol 5(6)-desaturase [Penicillium macrosclerotiorum]KAJ5675904.1 Delta(7)-sterol 5(6)-desaturase [Penicillium macrosclerotiorum]